MSNETIADLRTHLFAALRGLGDKDKPMDIDRAKAIADVGQVIINSAKVENEHLKLIGGAGTGFIPEEPRVPELPDGTKAVAKAPGVTVTRHTLKG